MGKGLVDLLRDEGHEGMQQLQDLRQHVQQHLLGADGRVGVIPVQAGLGQLDVPVAEGVPDEVVDLGGGHAQLVLVEVVRDLAAQVVELGQYPAVLQLQPVGQPVLLNRQVHHHEAGRVPQFVGEVAHGLAALHVKAHVVAGGVAGDQVEAKGVGAELLDHFDGIDAVPQALAHLAALAVAHQAVHDHGVEGRLLHVFAAAEDHAGDPEEDDVVAGHQDVRGIEVLQVLRLLGPAQRAERPQGGGEPGVEHVGIPLDVRAVAVLALGGVLPGDGHVAAVGAVPGRDLVAPPQLAGDAPVAHVVHPVQIGLAEAVGDEAHFAVLHDTDGLLCQGRHLHEPLGGGDGLHVGAAAVAGAHVVHVVLRLHQISSCFQIGQDDLPGLIAVQTVVPAAVDDVRVVVQDQDLLQTVAQADLEVVGVMAGGHLHAAGAEFHVHVLVGHDGDLPSHEGEDAGLAHQMGVAFVRGIDGHAGVAQHGLRPRGGHDHVLVAVLDGILQMPQLAGLLLVFHLGVAQGSGAVGAPVDDAAALVDQAFLVKADEDFADRPGALLVHGEAQAGPVAAGAQRLQLLQNAAAVLLLPGPHLVQELLAAKIETGQALAAQLLLHLDLGGDAGVVGAGQPEGGVALHPLVADQGVLDGLVESVPQMELPRHVGRRDDDGERFLVRVSVGGEPAAVQPHLVDALFRGLRIVHLGKLFHMNHSVLGFGAKENAPGIILRAFLHAVPPEFRPENGRHSSSR